MHQHRDNAQRMNILRINPKIDSKRRKALRDLKDLSLVGVGGLLGFKALQDSKIYIDSVKSSDSLESQLDFTQSTQALESTISNMDSSNIPSHILSLPLKYFNVPQDYSIILESNLARNQRENLTCIVPLLTSKDFNHAMPSLYHSYNVENIAKNRIYNQTSKFLQYHYDTLGSLLKDLETRGFAVREYRALSQDSKNPTQSLIQEIMQNLIIDTSPTISLDNILKYQVPKDSSLYKEFKNLENEKDDVSAIDAYNEALAILADYKDYFFTSTPKKNDQGKILSYKDDKNKARRLMQCLDVIGQNNIRALYVGVKKENLDSCNKNSLPANNRRTNTQENNHKAQQSKHPKLIGRLAITIIIEDGLWIG